LIGDLEVSSGQDRRAQMCFCSILSCKSYLHDCVLASVPANSPTLFRELRLLAFLSILVGTSCSSNLGPGIARGSKLDLCHQIENSSYFQGQVLCDRTRGCRINVIIMDLFNSRVSLILATCTTLGIHIQRKSSQVLLEIKSAYLLCNCYLLMSDPR
jgi:hypothetical protein